MIITCEKEQDYKDLMSKRVRYNTDVKASTIVDLTLNKLVDFLEKCVAEPLLVQRYKTPRSTSGIGAFMTDLFSEGSRKPDLHVMELEPAKQNYLKTIERLEARIKKLSKEGTSESIKNQIKGAKLRKSGMKRKLNVVQAHLDNGKKYHIIDGQHWSSMVQKYLNPESEMSFDGFTCQIHIDGVEYNFPKKQYFSMKKMLESDIEEDRIFANHLLYGIEPFSITSVHSDTPEALTRYFSGLNDGISVAETVRIFRSSNKSIIDQLHEMVLEPIADDSECPDMITKTYGEGIGKHVSDFYRDIRHGYQYYDVDGKRTHRTNSATKLSSWKEPESGTLAMLMNVAVSTMPNGFNRPLDDIKTDVAYMNPMFTQIKTLMASDEDLFMKDETRQTLQDMIAGYAVASATSRLTRGCIPAFVSFLSFVELMLKPVQKPTLKGSGGIKDRQWCTKVDGLDAWIKLASEFVKWSDNLLEETKYETWKEGDNIPPTFDVGDRKLDVGGKPIQTIDSYHEFVTRYNHKKSRTYRYKTIWNDFILPNMERWEGSGLISGTYEKKPTFGKTASFMNLPKGF